MPTRREINSKHEAAVIDAAVRAHNAQVNGAFAIESMPNPPDAILFDGDKRVWLEHTDAFYSAEWAEHLTSGAASNKPHRPMRKGLHIDMDNILADIFVDVVLKKVEKQTYRPCIEKFGPGVLVVGVESPWFDAETFMAISTRWVEHGSPDISHVFRWVYLGYRDADNKNVAIPWNSARCHGQITALNEAAMT